MSIFKRQAPQFSAQEKVYERPITIKAPNSIEAEKVYQILCKFMNEYGWKGIQELYNESQKPGMNLLLGKFRK